MGDNGTLSLRQAYGNNRNKPKPPEKIAVAAAMPACLAFSDDLGGELMNRMTCSWMTAALAICLFAPQGASAAEFHGTLSGTQFPAAIDTNSDGAAANEIVGTGRFTKLGKTSARGLNEVLPWDFSSMCSDSEILLESYFFHMIMTAENGDMLFTEQTDLELCYDVTDDSWDAVHTMDITGGTGQFSGATGSLVCENAGSPLYSPDSDVVGYTWQTYCHGELENVKGD